MMPWHKYHVTLTRLIEEECKIYVTAKDQEEAAEKALVEAHGVVTTVWRRTDTEPHSTTVEDIKEEN